MDEEEGLYANLVWTEATVRSGYTIYGARDKDVAITFHNSSDELMVFEVEETKAGFRSEETLMGIPDGEKQWHCEPDELAAIITAFANMNAAQPIFADYFLGLRELWRLIDLFNGVCIPVQIVDAVIGENDVTDTDFDNLANPKVEIPLDERIIGLMFMLAYRRGNVDRLFGRYVVIADEPITTDDLDDAVFEKLKTSGKLIEVRTAWHP